MHEARPLYENGPKAARIASFGQLMSLLLLIPGGSGMRFCLRLLLLAVLLTLCLPHLLWEKPLPSSDVNIRVDEAKSSHILYRKNLVAAHVNVVSGKQSRLLVAFPAGNSGVAVWLESPKGENNFDWARPPETSRGLGSVQAVTFEVRASQDELVINQAVLGGLRFIREWDIDKTKPVEIQETAELTSPNVLKLNRPSLDGKTYFRMLITVKNGLVNRSPEGRLSFTSAQAGQPLHLSITAISSEKPLTPIPADRMLTKAAINATPDREIQMLSFLLYKEKFLAGSWTYLTYFGRDTLLTLRFLMNSLTPEATESMLGAVVNRLREDGDVAHEEEIGDYASWKSHVKGEGFVSTPRYDYKMIDDDFLFPIILSRYVEGADHGRLKSFLAHKTDSGRTYREAILANLELVEKKTESFSRRPIWRNLIALPNGQNDGNWRDSQMGAGFGRYFYDVNVALVPAALRAAGKLRAAAEFGVVDESKTLELMHNAATWELQAPRFFRVEVPSATAAARADQYMKHQNLRVPATPTHPVAFNGVSLDEKGRVIPVMHSDEGFLLLFNEPSEEILLEVAEKLMTPFPFGLQSDIGMIVANPAFSPEKMQKFFTPRHYHGTVVWSWQQAMMAAALRRQIERKDLTHFTRDKLEVAEIRLWEMISRTQRYRTSELWTWRTERGGMAYAAFGHNEGDHAESNPNQGWSHAYIGVRPPASFTAPELLSAQESSPVDAN